MTDLSRIDPSIRTVLDPDEAVHAQAEAVDAILAVTDRRLVVVDAQRVALNVPLDRLRRVQFDIERERPATLVIVPEHQSDPPQVLAIEPRGYRAACDALAVIGSRLAGD